jgi:nucleotide-binding universal stress UspA family protein
MKQLKKILYVSERSVNQDATIARAVTLAKNNQADLTIMEVIPEEVAKIMSLPNGPVTSELMHKIKEQRREELESLIDPDKSQISPVIDIREGTKFLQVIRAVLADNYDLVIKPSENPDWIERLFGSDDMHLLRKCPCPVWLTKPDEKHDYDRILAAVDFNPFIPEPDDEILNKEILEMASFLALSDTASLDLVHAWDVPEAGLAGLWSEKPEIMEKQLQEGARTRHKAGMDKIVQKLKDLIGAHAYDYLSIKTHLPMGPARKAVPALAKKTEADLVVIGTVARTGIPGFIIGNTAESILDQLTCSVLALKPPGFVSPVTLV